MGNKIELMLEAERRGILPEDKRVLLNEARSRGLLNNIDDKTQFQEQSQPEPQDRSMLDHLGAFATGVTRGLAKAMPPTPMDYFFPNHLDKAEKSYQKNYGDSTAAWIGDMVGEGAALALPVSKATGAVAKGVQALPKIGQYAQNASNFKKYLGTAITDGAIGNVASGQINNSDLTADDIISDAVVGGSVGGGIGLAGRGIVKGVQSFVTPNINKALQKSKDLTADTKKTLRNKILADRLERIARKNFDVDSMRSKAQEFRDIGFNPELNDVADNLFMSEANAVRGNDNINDIINRNDNLRDEQIKNSFNKIVPESVNAEKVGGDIRHKAKTIVDSKNQREYDRLQQALTEIAPENVDIVGVGDDIRKQIDTVVTNNNQNIIKRAKPLYDVAKRQEPFYTVDKSQPVDNTPNIDELNIGKYGVKEALGVLNPDKDLSKRPLTQYFINMGGIAPGSDAAQQLYKIGIKPGENAPVGLFSKNGIKRLDAFDYNKDFASQFNITPRDNQGIDYYDVLERLQDEANGLGQVAIKDTPARRDLALQVQALGLNPDTITQDDLVSALVQRKKNDYVPNQEGLKNLSEQIGNFKTPAEVSKKVFDKYDLYKKYNLPTQLDQGQPNTQRFENVYDERAKFRRIPQDYYEKPFNELPIDDYNLNPDTYIHPESVALKNDKFIQDEIRNIRNSAYDFVDKNAPDDSIEMLLEVRNRLDDRIRSQPDADTKQYINSRNKINYALGTDPLTKKADDFYKIKYALKEAQNKDKYGQIMSVRDANVGAVVQNLMGKGTKKNQFESLTQVLQPKTKSEIAAAYLRNIMDNHNIDDGFENVYKNTFSTNDLKDKFNILLEPQNYQKLDNLMQGIKNQRPDKKKINQIAKIDDKSLEFIVPNLMNAKTSPQSLNRIGKVLNLEPKTKKDIITSHLRTIIDNLNSENGFDMVWNKSYSKPSVKAKIQSFLPENDFKKLNTVMDALYAIKATKYRLRGANTFNKIKQANVFNDPTSWVNIAKDAKTGGVTSAIFKILGKIMPNIDERKSAKQLYDFFVNPDNLDQSILVLEKLQKAKTAQEANTIFEKYLPQITKATSGVNRWANTAETQDN